MSDLNLGGPQAKGLVSMASVSIHAPVVKVWDALVNPELIKQYMFGAEVRSSWKVGAPITWTGSYEGKAYEDKGMVLRFEQDQVLQYSHFSPLTGKADAPENYHTVTMELSAAGDNTVLSLSQDNNATEAAREHTGQFWQGMLETLKKILEG